MRKTAFFLMCVIGFSGACGFELRAETVSSDTIWCRQKSPIHLTESVVVASNAVLRIESGVTIQASSNASLIVSGSLIAEGTEAEPILFSRDEAAESWPGIAFIGARFFDRVSCTGVLNHCRIEYAAAPEWPLYTFDAGVAARYAYLSVSNCLFEVIEGTVVRAEDSILHVADSRFDQCGEGINAVRCDARITGNRLSHIRNGADAIDVDMDWSGIEWKPARVESNVVDCCSGDGIDLGSSAATVRWNQIRNCADKGISIGEGSNGRIENNEVLNCRIGIAVKDSSAPLLVSNTVTSCEIGISAYEKEPGMGGARGLVLGGVVRACGQDIVCDDLSLLEVRDFSIESGTFTNSAPSVVINEIMYCPASKEDADEFIELYNYGATAVSLDGWQLVDEVRFDFPAGTVLLPNAYLVIAANPDSFVGALGPWEGSLDDDMAAVRLVDSGQLGLDSVEYKTFGGWPAVAAGSGPSLELLQAEVDNNDPENWAGSAESGGTPGAPNSRTPCEMPGTLPAPKVVINEIMYHPVSDNDGEEYIELYNASGENLNLSGWEFTDGFSYCFPRGSTLAAGDYLVVANDPAAVSATYNLTGVFGPFADGKLSNRGERVELRDAWSNLVDAVEYQDSGAWPCAADGEGAALELLDPSLDNNDPAFWVAGEGSPGSVNNVTSSCAAAIRSAAHFPVTPEPTEIVTVRARVAGAADVRLYWKRDQDHVFNTLSMTNGGSGVYCAEIPPQAHRTLVEYYIEAEDAHGETVAFPFGAPLFHLSETDHDVPYTLRYVSLNSAPELRVPTFRILMPSETREELESNLYSDQLLPVTMIYMDEVFPFARLRYRGGTKRLWDIKSYRIDLSQDHPFAGESKLDMNGKRPGPEWLATEYGRQRGLAVPIQRNIRLHINYSDQGPYLLTERIGKEYLERNFPGVDRGEWYESWGEDAADYPAAVSNALTAILEASADAPESIANAMDPDQWIRWLVCTEVLGDSETLLAPLSGNHACYVMPATQRLLLEPLDLDITWRAPQNVAMDLHMNPGTWDLGMEALNAFMRIPYYQRNYYQALVDELDRHFTPEQLTEPINQYFSIVGSYAIFESDAGQALNYLSLRRTNLEAQVCALAQNTSAFCPEICAPHSETVFWWPYADGWLSGKVLPGTAAVWINGSTNGVTLCAETGSWMYEAELPEGDTQIALSAQPLRNRAYSTATQTITVRYDSGDDDGDSLPNSWERFYGLDPEDGNPDSAHGANGDPDGDGITNAEEYETHTAPVSGVQFIYPTITDFGVPLQPEVFLSWSAFSGAVYRVQTTDHLAALRWKNVGEAITAESSFASVEIQTEPAGTNRFYRVILTEWPTE